MRVLTFRRIYGACMDSSTRWTTCAVAIMALTAACASHRAAENGAAEPDLELVEGRPYTMNEVYPLAAENDLRFDATATIDSADPAVIHAEVTITNARNARRRIGFDRGCDDVRLRLYASPERTSAPVWDSAKRARPDLTGRMVVCAGTGGMQLESLEVLHLANRIPLAPGTGERPRPETCLIFPHRIQRGTDPLHISVDHHDPALVAAEGRAFFREREREHSLQHRPGRFETLRRCSQEITRAMAEGRLLRRLRTFPQSHERYRRAQGDFAGAYGAILIV